MATKISPTKGTGLWPCPKEIRGTDIQQVKWSNIVHELLFQPLVSFDTELKKLLPEGQLLTEISADGTRIYILNCLKIHILKWRFPYILMKLKSLWGRYKETSPLLRGSCPGKGNNRKRSLKHWVMKLENSAAFLWPVPASTYAGG